MFRQMHSQLQQSGQWDQQEAALFIMTAVARNILPEEDTIVPGVLGQVLALPTTAHTAVRLTATRLVGELCEWIEKVCKNCKLVMFALEAFDNCSSTRTRCSPF